MLNNAYNAYIFLKETEGSRQPKTNEKKKEEELESGRGGVYGRQKETKWLAKNVFSFASLQGGKLPSPPPTER